MRSVQQNLETFERVGIRPVAISTDSPEESSSLSETAGYKFTFLSDQNNEAIRSYDLMHAGAGIEGENIARPAEFLLDSTGVVRWMMMTENYWVRARPEQILEAAKMLDQK